MNVHILIALLVKFANLAEDDAKKLAEALNSSVLPSRYQDAKVLVDKIWDDIKE